MARPGTSRAASSGGRDAPELVPPHRNARGPVIAEQLIQLMQRSARGGGCWAVRVSNRDASGRVFIDRGRIVHAEFAEDYGLRALVEVLRADLVGIECESGGRPHGASLHLGVELLRALVDRKSDEAPRLDTAVVRKVDVPVEPPPLPEPDIFDDVASVRASGVVPCHAAAQPSAMIRVSGEGQILAAHGHGVHGEAMRELAEAALLIHRLASAIALDLGSETAGVCVSAGDRVLFVARSELGDIGAGIGESKRLDSLLGRLGVR